ncbi:MAG: ABC transporter ATP-binding protein [Bacilli bacterium]
MDKIIEIKNVSIDYNEDDDTLGAINDASLNIYKNDFICIVGPSGCGKSTLLKAIAGFIKPNKGQILMNNQEITGPNRTRGIVFQESNLFPWFTAKQNVAMGPRFSQMTKQNIDQICDKYLEQVDLIEYKNTKVFELSGGQKQRVAIARTLANNPEVILMDEPFGALDSFTRNKMQIMLRDLWNKNHSTVFFVTHDIDEALLLGTSIYVMKTGSPSILKSYQIDYTFRLLNNPHEHVEEEKQYLQTKQEILSLLEE